MMASMLGFVRDQIQGLKQQNEENAKKYRETLANLDLEASTNQKTLQAMREKLGLQTKDMVGVDTSLKGAELQHDLLQKDSAKW